MRLNLGCGDLLLDGYVNLDGKRGDEIYPLLAPDGMVLYQEGSVDEIRASHILEHFGHREIPDVLADWVRALKPGGKLKIAVPDFEAISRAYLSGVQMPTEGFVMGGQVDERDFHKAIFDMDSLRDLMRAAGLRSICKWESDAPDCSSYAISLNLEGIKRRPLTKEDVKALNVSCVMSVPRLGFMDNFFCMFRALAPMGIPFKKLTGAFWGQCLEHGMQTCLDEGREWILTADYDSVFTQDALRDLLELARDTDADALVPIQAHRTKATPLMTMCDEEGMPMRSAPIDAFHPEITKVTTAHFGLTLIRASALRDIPNPWFWSHPGDGGKWGDGRIDDDISFWRKWREYGKTLYLANHVTIGHAELMVRWPSKNFQAMYQHPSEFEKSGKPEGVWI
ncbi:MAG: hypothetical protein OES09_00075 [Gammaproteobacteria bacterium]|nr:hypothetical protein [Gammaproteobacteria bacterium]